MAVSTAAMSGSKTPRISLEPFDEFEMYRQRAAAGDPASPGYDSRYRRVSDGAAYGHRLTVTPPGSEGVKRRASYDTGHTTQLLLPPEDAPCLSPSIRRRSFCTTTGGVVNSGDVIIDDVDVVNTILTRSREGSTETDVSDMSCGSAGAGAMMRVLVIGAAGVGKTALTQQFMTSEHIAAQNNSFEEDCVEVIVPVQLDSREYILQFIDLPYNGKSDAWREHEASCYVIVFAINDRRSYVKALDILCDLRQMCLNAAVVLVANKSDLVRTRIVGEQEGRSACDIHACPYLEVSAVINHRVDELLVTIVKEALGPRGGYRSDNGAEGGHYSEQATNKCWPRSGSPRFLSSLYHGIRRLSKSADSVTYRQ